MDYQKKAEQKEQRRVIAAATALTMVVLILLTAAIVLATKKSRPEAISNSEYEDISQVAENSQDNGLVQPSEENETETINEAGQVEPTDRVTDIAVGSPSSDATSANGAIDNVTTRGVSDDKIPTTGPMDILPVALMIGTTVAFFGSRKLMKDGQVWS